MTWWEPSSTSTMRSGSAGVRPAGTAARLTPPSPLTLCWVLCSDSGVGAGIDSYYEYLMKAYILLGDGVFLDRFNVVSPPAAAAGVPARVLPLTPACAPALQRHHEVHQPAASAAQRAHAQSHRQRPQLDGLSPGVLPRSAGQE